MPSIYTKKGKRPLIIDGDIAIVELTKGYFCGIDAADADLIGLWNWSTGNGRGMLYARRNDNDNGKYVYLHRFLLGINSAEIKIDHINGETLDCRKLNLRVVTSSQNSQNTKISKSNRSGTKGVLWREKDRFWISSIRHNGKVEYLGCYKNKSDAVTARKNAEEKLHGEFARRLF